MHGLEWMHQGAYVVGITPSVLRNIVLSVAVPFLLIQIVVLYTIYQAMIGFECMVVVLWG